MVDRYPASVRKIIKTCHSKGMKSVDAVKKINESKTVQKLGVSYSERQIRSMFSAMTKAEN